MISVVICTNTVLSLLLNCNDSICMIPFVLLYIFIIDCMRPNVLLDGFIIECSALACVTKSLLSGLLMLLPFCEPRYVL